MSHVAEGELHAWLDGALDQLGEKRAQEVREHLRGCAACQENLASEEAVRARATEVLGLATPRAAEMPPLEALLERARAVPTPAVVTKSRMSRGARLGWAASVVLALGAGWMARELGLHGPMVDAPEVTAPTSPAPTTVANADGGPAPADATAGEVVAARDRAVAVEEAAPTRVAAAPVVADPAAGAALDRAVSDLAASTEKMEQAVPSDVVASAPPPAFEPPAPARASVASEAAVAEPRQLQAQPTPPPSAPGRVAASERAGAVVGNRAANASARPAPRQEVAASSAVPQTGVGGIGIQRARAETARSDVPNLFVEGRGAASAAPRRSQAITSEADESEARDLIVAGLEFLRADWTEVAPGQTGLLVLQKLSSGDTLEVRFVRSNGAAADALSDPLASVRGAELTPGWNQVILERGDGWVVARAPLTEVRLRELLGGLGQSPR